MIATILVRARPGVRVPMAGMARRHIEGDDIVPVEDCHYYRKQIEDGDLILVDPATATLTEESP